MIIFSRLRRHKAIKLHLSYRDGYHGRDILKTFQAIYRFIQLSEIILRRLFSAKNGMAHWLQMVPAVKGNVRI